MVALGAGLAALALPGPGQLLEAAVKLLDLPAYPHGRHDHLARQMSSQVVGNEPHYVERPLNPARGVGFNIVFTRFFKNTKCLLAQ